MILTRSRWICIILCLIPMILMGTAYAYMQHAKGPLSRTLEPQAIYELNSDSIHFLEVEGQYGSAVSITPEILVTNCHVLSRGVSFKIDDQIKLLQVINADYKHLDLCFIYVPEMNFKPVTIRPSSEVKIGEKAYTIGNPIGLKKTLSQGLISNFRDDKLGRRWLQSDAPVSPGSSGGGLFDDRGNLIGVTSSIIPNNVITFAAQTNVIPDVIELSKSLPTNILNKKQQEFASAFALHEKNIKTPDNKEIIAALESCANNGNIYCELELGHVYLKKKKYKEAFDLMQQAAAANIELAHFTLSEMYYHGLGVAKDIEKSLEHSKKAAILGDQVSAYNLSAYYYNKAIKNSRNKKLLEENAQMAYAWLKISILMGQTTVHKKSGTASSIATHFQQMDDYLFVHKLKDGADKIADDLCAQITRCVQHSD
jgi:tetratricopeptide (TPR) repeat protein